MPNYEGMIISKVHRESIGDLSQRRPVAAHPQPAATSQATRAADPPAPRPKIKVKSAQSNGNTAPEPDLIGGNFCCLCPQDLPSNSCVYSHVGIDDAAPAASAKANDDLLNMVSIAPHE